MYINQPKLDWEFLADEDAEAPWPPVRQEPQRNCRGMVRHPLWRAALVMTAMVVLLAAGAGVVRLNHRAAQGVGEVEQGVEASVDAAQWVERHEPELSTVTLADELARHYVAVMVKNERALLAAYSREDSPKAEVRVVDTRFRGQSAAAELTVTLPAGPGAQPTVFRQTRFYRETAQGWLRTRPNPALWGEPRTLETDHLTWRYRQRDEEAVQAVAGGMDALYTLWRRDHGLGDAEGDKLVVDVRVDLAPAYVTVQETAIERVSVPSPAVYLAPDGYADEEILAQATALALLEHLWAAMAGDDGGETPAASHSYEAVAGLHLWEVVDAGLGLFDGGEDFVGTYLRAAQSHEAAAAMSTGRFDELCRAMSVWMIRPAAVGAPIECKGALSVALLYGSDLSSPGVPLRLGPATGEEMLNYEATWRAAYGRTLIVSTVFDYAAATYGRDRLPSLMAALDGHRSWETLAPAVFGVPFTEFEEGWRQHLAHLAE